MGTIKLARAGSIAYVLWGLLHLQAAFMVYKLSTGFSAGMAQGRLLQLSWTLFFASVAAIAVAATMNWKNRRDGYWINAILVGLLDLGFIFFVLIPGYVPPWPGALGPVAWLAAWGLSWVALRLGTH